MNLLETPPVDDDDRTIWSNKYRLQFQAQLFLEEDKFQPRLEELKSLKVIKYGRFMQSLFYLLGYTKDKIVEPGTQKFFWKSAKTLLDEEFVQKLLNFETMGPKTEDFLSYQQLNFIERNISGIVPADVDEFNMTLGRLFKWLILAIENRRNNIIRRKALIAKDRDERDSKIKAQEERAKARDAAIEAARAAFLEENKDAIQAYEDWKKIQEGGGDDYGLEEDEAEEAQENKEPPVLPEFNQAEEEKKFDEEFPEIEILGAAGDEIDNDWLLSEEEVEEQIQKYWSAKTES